MGNEPFMQITGWAVVSVEGAEKLWLREGYIKGTEPILTTINEAVEPPVSNPRPGMGGRKCIRSQRKSFIGHPDTM